MVMDTGRLCIKTAGRDAGKKCVVVEVVDKTKVLVDGETRRKNCNISRLEPLAEKLNIKEGASHADVEKEFKKLGLETRNTKPKKSTAQTTTTTAQKK